MALFLAAGTALSGTTFTEVVDTNYARLPVTMTPVAQSSSRIAAAGTFAATTFANVTVVAEAIFDSATGGAMLLCWQRTPAPLNTTTTVTHPNPLIFNFPDDNIAGATSATIWPQGAVVGTFIGSTDGFSRTLVAGVTICLAGATPIQSFGAQPAAAITALIARNLPQIPGLVRSWLPNSKNFAVAGASVFTLATQFGLESDYSLVRLVFSNNSAGAFTIPLCKLSPSSTLGNGGDPTNAAGTVDFTMYQTVTWNNAGLDVAPMDQTAYGSGPTTFTVPASAGSATQPVRWYSDWIRCISLSRIDGGVNPLLMVRTLTDALGTYRYPNLATSTWGAFSQGRTLATFTVNGADKVTAPSALGTAVLTGTQACEGVQYYTPINAITVLSIGDSLMQGFGSTTFFHGWPYLSCLALSTPSRPVSYWCQAVQGSTSPDYWQNGYNAMKTCKPEIAVISTWTPNDAHTQANADAGFSRALELANYAMKNGTVPVLSGPLPYTTVLNAAEDAMRLSVRNRMLQAGAYGMQVLDWEQLMGTGASPNRVRADLLAGDGLHPNDIGNGFMDTAVFRPILRNLIK